MGGPVDVNGLQIGAAAEDLAVVGAGRSNSTGKVRPTMAALNAFLLLHQQIVKPRQPLVLDLFGHLAGMAEAGVPGRRLYLNEKAEA